MSEIGIVIVTWNSEAAIGACLDAALRTGAEIVVVDNASQDGTAAEAARRGVRVIANPMNRGFAGAANQGFAVLKSPYVLLLNPDAVIATTLEPLRRACGLPRAAGAGGRLLDCRGVPQRGFMARSLPTPAALILEVLVLNRLWPKNPVNRRYRRLDRDVNTFEKAEQPAGAFLMVRRAVWEELGGFDESFHPLWFEDVDFCRRAIDRGYAFYYSPDAVANHTGGHSIVQLAVELRRFYWYRSLLSYSAKHFHRVAFRAVCLAVVAGSALRSAAESVCERSLKPLATYGSVVRLAGRCLFFGRNDKALKSGPLIQG